MKLISQRKISVSNSSSKSPPPPPPIYSGTPKKIHTSVKAVPSAKKEFYADKVFEDEVDDLIIEKKPLEVVNGFEGSTCRKCKFFYTHSEPNMDDGTFLCYECKFDKKMKEENS